MQAARLSARWLTFASLILRRQRLAVSMRSDPECRLVTNPNVFRLGAIPAGALAAPAFTQYLHTIPSQYRTLRIITAALRKLSALAPLVGIAASVAASALISFPSCLCKDTPRLRLCPCPRACEGTDSGE